MSRSHCHSYGLLQWKGKLRRLSGRRYDFAASLGSPAWGGTAASESVMMKKHYQGCQPVSPEASGNSVTSEIFRASLLVCLCLGVICPGYPGFADEIDNNWFWPLRANMSPKTYVAGAMFNAGLAKVSDLDEIDSRFVCINARTKFGVCDLARNGAVSLWPSRGSGSAEHATVLQRSHWIECSFQIRSSSGPKLSLPL